VNDFGVGADPARLNTSGQNQSENERNQNLHFVETKNEDCFPQQLAC
jgi:hypothetical protein